MNIAIKGLPIGGLFSIDVVAWKAFAGPTRLILQLRFHAFFITSS
jgi:hypothetical protein